MARAVNYLKLRFTRPQWSNSKQLRVAELELLEAMRERSNNGFTILCVVSEV